MTEEIFNILKAAGISGDAAESIAHQISNVVGKETVPKREFNSKSILARSLQEELRKMATESENQKKSAASAELLRKQFIRHIKKSNSDLKELETRLKILECRTIPKSRQSMFCQFHKKQTNTLTNNAPCFKKRGAGNARRKIKLVIHGASHI
ncbi:MAG TPA: hypothetical protein VHR42_03815 [Clostridia bacterium]|nr:hypothetical protein [Clostridia bacterium]